MIFSEFVANELPKKMPQKEVGKVLKRVLYQKIKRKSQTTGWEMQSPQTCVSNNIKLLYELHDKVAKDFYDLKIINSDQVRIQPKTTDTFKTVVKEVESKNRTDALKFSLEISTHQLIYLT